MEKQVTRVPVKPTLERLQNVAAYARVSSGKDAMLHSLAAQVSYYSQMIREHSDEREIQRLRVAPKALHRRLPDEEDRQERRCGSTVLRRRLP